VVVVRVVVMGMVVVVVVVVVVVESSLFRGFHGRACFVTDLSHTCSVFFLMCYGIQEATHMIGSVHDRDYHSLHKVHI